jgi:hypothetical protein
MRAAKPIEAISAVFSKLRGKKGRFFEKASEHGAVRPRSVSRPRYSYTLLHLVGLNPQDAQQIVEKWSSMKLKPRATGC